ncbi:hypothetical protein B0H13DRAFT_1623025 [Mycena leptocephala]|nr:hypothetical protein B0H13DRAFT_1623025 [Mycena leptocephala]
MIPKEAQIHISVTVEDRLEYERASVPGTEATSGDYFRIDILGTPNSPWNKSAARVFTSFTIDQNSLPNTTEMFDAIRRAFTTHLETIIRRYKDSLKSQNERACRAALDRRQSRKYELFYRRRYLAYTFKPLQRHIDMIEYLGIDGMSSDSESEDGVSSDHHMRYRIHPPQWRAGRVEPWLRMFDSIHNILRRSGGSHDRRGAFPRIRTPTNRKSASIKFVDGLPINTYDTEWMDRDLLRKYDLRPSRQPYDFTHDDDVVLYVDIIFFFFFCIPDQFFWPSGWLFVNNDRRCS